MTPKHNHLDMPDDHSLSRLVPCTLMTITSQALDTPPAGSAHFFFSSQMLPPLCISSLPVDDHALLLCKVSSKLQPLKASEIVPNLGLPDWANKNTDAQLNRDCR